MSSDISTLCSPSKNIRPNSMDNQLALQYTDSILFLDELKPATPEIRTIRIRIVRMWKDYSYNDTINKKSGIGLIVADEKGNFGNAKVTPLN
ncbi:hypothetical protein ACHQM5_012198 [Ranunculus cassubicifolius]